MIENTKRWSWKPAHLPYRHPARYYRRPGKHTQRNAWKNWRQREALYLRDRVEDPDFEEGRLPFRHRHRLLWDVN